MAKTNYIQNMVKTNGENWIVTVTPDDIQRNSKRIFKEIVKGFIDYQEVGHYFLDPKFLDNLIISCQNELEINTLYCNAVAFFQKYNPGYPNITVQLNHLQALCYIYSVLLNKLLTVKNSNNFSCLVDTCALLCNYKNHLI